METSIFLAKVIGIVSVVSITAILSRYKKSLALEAEAAQSVATIYISGFVIIIIGVLLIVSHQVWALDWRIAITIIGWAVFIKGVGRIFFPDAVQKLIGKKRHNHWFILGEVIMLFVGLYLLYYGFAAY